MKLTDRDRKVMIVVLLLAFFGGYWFLLLSPKRSEADKAEQQLSKQQGELSKANAEVVRQQGQRTSFASDYAEIVKLGKAIPSNVDMPSLLVQLQAAAKGTGTDFRTITIDATASPGGTPAAPAPASGGAQAPAAPAGNAAPGGKPAGTGLGRATETAGNKVNGANAKSEKDSKLAPGETQTSQSAQPGAASATGASPQAPGLTSVPLHLTFDGSFFKLADFFHRLKRFVYVANDRIRVQGRLISVDSLTFSTAGFPQISVEVGATAYLTPKDQGLTAGANPSGPASTQPTAPASGGGAPSKAPTTPPTAVGAP